MASSPNRTVRNAPKKPLLIFDGECLFCLRWIERWKEITGEAVEYTPFQAVTELFPEIPQEDFRRSVQLIATDGTVSRGADAVFRSLGQKPGRRWMTSCYKHLPGFARITEGGYRFVAEHRGTASFFTRLFWGKDVRQPTYFDARRWFLRSLGCIFLIAFVSLWMQVDGLIGEQGIFPVSEFLPAAQEHYGAKAVSLLPTLCWINDSDAFLYFLCGGGAFFSILLMAGFAPVLLLTLLFIFYLSLTIAGQTFLSFQWDILLLETGFLAIFFAPWQWRLTGTDRDAPVSRVGHFLLKLLLFKLMFMSGIVKLTSGDDSWGWIDHSFQWSAFTALDYHYWTQPLPTVFAWWADKHSEWFKHSSVAFCLVVEIVVPFFIWAPRRLRLIACALLIFLQIVIAITGNYCFFNLLTIALCLLLIDDSVWRRSDVPIGEASPRDFRRYWNWAAIPIAIITLPVNAALIQSAFEPRGVPSRWIGAVYDYFEPFRIVNGYGLFRVMTKSRPEIVIEGSTDGVEWRAYEFHWKPGDINRPPPWVAPHQPRLDWQMWFAALGTARQNPWFIQLVRRLLEESPSVMGLLAYNPFPDKPPRYIRATTYDYHFTTAQEHKASGAWWKREGEREYLPPISLKQ